MTRFSSLAALEAATGRKFIQSAGHLIDAARGHEITPLTTQQCKPALSTIETCHVKPSSKAVARDELSFRPMNKTERRYRDEILQPAVQAGQIRRFEFEAIKIRLGFKLTYTPDFYVVSGEGHIEIHETKGAWIYEDGMIKFKMAAELFPEWAWKLWQWKNNRWSKILEL